jgi:hypothetical protein
METTMGMSLLGAIEKERQAASDARHDVDELRKENDRLERLAVKLSEQVFRLRRMRAQ